MKQLKEAINQDKELVIFELQMLFQNRVMFLSL